MYFLQIRDEHGNVVNGDAMFHTSQAAHAAADELKQKVAAFGFHSPYIEVTYREV